MKKKEKKKAEKKLALKKETLRELGQTDLKQAAGGTRSIKKYSSGGGTNTVTQC